jgi:hypothetical protein
MAMSLGISEVKEGYERSRNESDGCRDDRCRGNKLVHLAAEPIVRLSHAEFHEGAEELRVKESGKKDGGPT